MAPDSFPFDAVFWDIDGTLADSEPVHERSFWDICQGLDIVLPADFQEQVLGSSEEAVHGILVRDYGLSLDLDTFVARRLEAYLARIGEVKIHPDAAPIWRALVAAKVPMAMVSNSGRVIVEANLTEIGIGDSFPCVTRDDVSEGKPAPEPYLLAAQRLGVDPARVAVLEDSKTGMTSGLAAGMTVFMMPHFSGAPDGSWRPVSELRAKAESLLATQAAG